MHNILVTGGAGFIGSNFINTLFNMKSDFYTIVCIDKLTYAGKLNNIKSFNKKNYHFYKCDINSTSDIIEIIKKHNINIIVNFAAESHVDNSIKTPTVFVQTNVLGTNNLLECAKLCWRTNYSANKFIQVSTDEVYGSLNEHSDNKFTEQSSLEPHSPYSASKAAADLLALSYYHTFGLPVIITRCSNNYGAQQHNEKFIPTIITNALQNKPLPIYGDGMNIRDWIYVEDHCLALMKIIKNGKIGNIYNIGANCEKTNIEIVNTILDILQKPKNLIRFVEDRLGHDRKYAVDATKIINELNWKPKTTFEDNIKTTIKWYKNIVSV